MHNYDDPEYFLVPIDWDVANYLLKKYREDWEGTTPNGVDLDSWYHNLKKATEKHSQIRRNYDDDPEYFWVPIDWDVANYLLKKYREDWEGTTPNGVDLDSWYHNLKKAAEKHSRIRRKC